MKLKPFQIDTTSGKVDIDAGWQPIIEQCCELKEALDHASRWPKKTTPKTIEEVLQKHSIKTADIPSHSELRGNLPVHFACLLGGESIFGEKKSHRETHIPNAGVPGWATLGWVRKDGYEKTPTMSRLELASKADLLPKDASTYVVEGIPLFMAGEGKNRTQLQRLAHTIRETKLTVRSRPNTSDLCARPLAFAPGILVLEAPNCYQLLPFRFISQCLLCAIGVKWSTWPSLKPWLGDAWKLGMPWKKGNVEKRIRVGLLRR